MINAKTKFRHDGPLSIASKVKLKEISLDLRGPTTLAPGADLELDILHMLASCQRAPGADKGRPAMEKSGPVTTTEPWLPVEEAGRGI